MILFNNIRKHPQRSFHNSKWPVKLLNNSCVRISARVNRLGSYVSLGKSSTQELKRNCRSQVQLQERSRVFHVVTGRSDLYEENNSQKEYEVHRVRFYECEVVNYTYLTLNDPKRKNKKMQAEAAKSIRYGRK